MLLGVKTISGLRHVRSAWRRNRWKILRGSRRLADLHVVARGELQKALDARAGMLRALAFVAVRKQHDESGEQIPTCLRRR